MAIKKTKYKYKKKFQAGTQMINGSADPTKLYEAKREDTVAADQFNNAEQAALNRDVKQQEITDSATSAVGDAEALQKKKADASSGIGSALRAINPLIGVGMEMASSTTQKLEGASLDQALKTGEGKKGSKNVSRVTTDTGTKLLAAENNVDLIEAFIPLDFGDSSVDIREREAVNAQQKENTAKKQVENYGAIDNTVQATQVKKGRKNLRYKMKAGSREIETEGREPIFSPKKSDGTRDLLYYNPNDPTHKEGGVKAVIVPKSKYKMSSDSSLKVPEGSAIVTANAGKNKQAIEAYKKKDYKKLDKVINQMPEDNPKKKKAGGWGSTDLLSYNSSNKDVPTARLDDEEETTSLVTDLDMKNKKTSTPISAYDNTDTGKVKGKSSISTDGLAGMASGLYNVAKGIRDKPVKTERRYLKSEGYKYKDRSAPQRRAAEEQMRVESNNIRNATGGSGGTFLANQSMASANRFKNMSDINNQEAAKRDNIENANVDLRNKQQAANLQAANQYDDTDLQHKGKQSEYVGKGIEQVSNVAQMRELNKNRATSDEYKTQLIGTGKYKMKDGKVVPTDEAKKGKKNLKYKMKK